MGLTCIGQVIVKMDEATFESNAIGRAKEIGVKIDVGNTAKITLIFSPAMCVL